MCRMRCVKPLEFTETCGFDPYKVCEMDAKCWGSVCFREDVGGRCVW